MNSTLGSCTIRVLRDPQGRKPRPPVTPSSIQKTSSLAYGAVPEYGRLQSKNRYRLFHDGDGVRLMPVSDAHAQEVGSTRQRGDV